MDKTLILISVKQFFNMFRAKKFAKSAFHFLKFLSFHIF
jgi:hypothetical protein